MQDTSVSIVAGEFSYIALRTTRTIFLVLSLFTVECAIALMHLRYTNLNVVVFGLTLDIWRGACYSIWRYKNVNLLFYANIHNVYTKIGLCIIGTRIPLHSPLSQNGLAVPMHDDSIPHWHCFNEDSQCSPGLSSAHSWSQALSSYALLDSK